MRMIPTAAARSESPSSAGAGVARSIWRSVSTLALASVASLALLHAVEPAAAKPMNTCSQRHVACSKRCVMNNKGDAKTAPKDGVGGCISRTCDHQMKACMAGTRDVRPNEGQGPIIRDKRTRR